MGGRGGRGEKRYVHTAVKTQAARGYSVHSSLFPILFSLQDAWYACYALCMFSSLPNTLLSALPLNGMHVYLHYGMLSSANFKCHFSHLIEWVVFSTSGIARKRSSKDPLRSCVAGQP